VSHWCLVLFFFFFFFFKLRVHYIAQAGPELAILCPSFQSARITGMYHHAPQEETTLMGQISG
jgi:hypothetical protein